MASPASQSWLVAQLVFISRGDGSWQLSTCGWPRRSVDIWQVNEWWVVDGWLGSRNTSHATPNRTFRLHSLAFYRHVPRRLTDTGRWCMSDPLCVKRPSGQTVCVPCVYSCRCSLRQRGGCVRVSVRCTARPPWLVKSHIGKERLFWTNWMESAVGIIWSSIWSGLGIIWTSMHSVSSFRTCEIIPLFLHINYFTHTKIAYQMFYILKHTHYVYKYKMF
jgi:hypothetical protein